MPSVNLGDLPDAVQRALQVRAIHHGHSTEAEIKAILETATLPPGRLKLGSLLTSIAKEAGPLTDDEVEFFARIREKTSVEPMDLE